MSAPANKFAYDIEMIEKAAANWRSRKHTRDKDIRYLKQKRYLEVEPKERLTKRANRILNKFKQALPLKFESLPSDLRDVINRGQIDEDEINDDLFERVIGETRDFLMVSFLENGFQAMRAVGRVVMPLGNGRVSYGTGFLVAPHMMMTNWHVLKSYNFAANSVFEMDYQLDRLSNPLSVHKFNLTPETFFLNNKDLDFALVAVAEASDKGRALTDYGYCPLIKDEGKIIKGNCVNIIQHPRGEMKQVVLRENRLVDLLDRFAHYQGDTEPGSSGSPVFNDEWEVIALHHSGVPKTDDDGNFLTVDGDIWKPGDNPEQLAWIANEGIRVSRLVSFIDKAKVKEHEKRLKDQFLNVNESTPALTRIVPRPMPSPVVLPGPGDLSYSKGVADKVKPAIKPVPMSMPAGMLSLTVPMNITLSFGTPGSAQNLVLDGDIETIDTQESIKPDPDYGNRPGYDTDFLGFSVPMPKLMNSIRNLAAHIDGTDEIELKYHHYSAIMHKKRRLAFVSAVNFEGNPEYIYERTGKDRWFFDPRLGREFQAGNEFYADNPLDRGHLVRRADAAWGDTEEEAKLANDDTFHFTNCSPQHEVFNQSSKAIPKGLRLWGNIEEHISEQAYDNEKRLCIFNGPIFRATDPNHRGLQVPREFWKIVVFKNDSGKPVALAFRLSQSSLIKNLPEEEFEVGPYHTYQIRIREIENQTKLDFGKLKDYDPLAGDEHESLFEAETDAIMLNSLDNIVC